MSGNDERLVDFPECPHCGRLFYWREARETGLSTCFNSRRYLEKYPNSLIVNSREGIEHLNEIAVIECAYCGYRAPIAICEKIIKLAKHYYGLRGCDVWK
jgi:hypothetical protein